MGKPIKEKRLTVTGMRHRNGRTDHTRVMGVAP